MNRKVILGTVVAAVAAVLGFVIQRTLAERPALVEEQMRSAEGSDAGDSPPSDASAAERGLGASGGRKHPEGADAHSSTKTTDDADEPRRNPIPETLPAIALPDRDGVTRPLSQWKGRPVLINFWATWCGPCREEIPLLKTLRNERSADRLEIIGIAIDQRDAVLRYAREIGIDYPILIGEKEGYAAAEAFGVSLVLPFSVFADSQGRIVTLKIGELHANEAAFILDRVRDIDGQRLTLPVARQQIADKMRRLSIERAKNNTTEG
jgi:thiol-disulfide isomerase/thioredoxin